MCQMIDEAYQNGVRILYATSHQTPGYEAFDAATYAAHLDEARAYCKERGYDLEIRAGAEHLYTPMLRNVAEENELQTLGDSYVTLVEFVPDVSYGDICSAIESLLHNGYQPLLAHIERYECLVPGFLNRGKAYELKKRYKGILFQVNCRSVIDAKEAKSKHGQTVRRWLKDQLIDRVASDMHDCKHRRNRMADARSALLEQCSEDYADYLMSDIG